MRVLIAEDDAVSRTLLKKAVERFGHECLTAEDGEKAWELFRNTPEVDVVISDWMMPGIDGLELCRLVRQASRLEYTFFIFLTVLGDKKHLLEGMRTGADDYLAKPLDGEQLQARLIAASRVTSLHRKLRHEIAERKRAEELMAGQTRHAQLRSEVSEVLAKGGSLQDTLQRCTEVMTRHLDVALARVWTFNEEESVLELRASAGLYEGTGGPLSRVPVGEKNRRPYVTNDIPNDPRFEGKVWAEREGLVATANYPLVVEGELVGAAALFSREPLAEYVLEAMASASDAIAQGIKRKQTEMEFKKAEERYRTLVEQIPAVTYVQEVAGPESNRTNPTMYASPQIETQLGYPPQAFVDDPEFWIRLLHPADRARVLAEDERTDETGEPFRVEYRQIARDGRVVWIRDEAVLVRDEEGRPRYWLGVQHDITEEKQAEKALKESELRLRSVIANVPVVLFALDLRGVFTLSEGKGLDALGLEPGEIVGHSISELYGDRQEILDDVDRALAGEEFSAVREIDSRVFETWYSPVRAKTGEVSGVIGVATDVTERKQAEEALREAEELFHSAFDNAPIGIAVSQPDGHYLRVNRALCEILGYSEEELRATTFQALTYPEDTEASMAYVDRLLAGEIDKYSLEKRYVRADGRPVWVSLSVSLVRAPDDRPLYYVAQVQDITERKRAEERLQEANRHLEMLATLRADFTAMVAHELGSPLAAIRGFLDVLATGELDPAERDGALAKIRAETDRLSTLIADVRSASAVESGDFALMPRQTPVEELFKDATRFAETLPGNHPVVVEIETEEQVWADRYRVGQVLRNLLSNAAKYSPDGAPIELRAMRGKTPGRVRIEVVDRGRGVHLDDAERIFEKFGRGRDQSGRKAYGVGLGLYVSRRIVRAHGGELTLDPAPVGGSVFGFDLEAVR